jgi:hypothetical protein
VLAEYRGRNKGYTYSRILSVESDRFVNFTLESGRECVLSPYVEVEVLTNAYYWCHQAPRA